jgi:diketogulonate reductase-like aldo/keto reductase
VTAFWSYHDVLTRGSFTVEYSVLSNNRKMPMLGFGVFKVTDKAECKQAVLNAIRTGYRLIDTAAVYDNEDAVGEAVREAIAEGLCTREALFITSKLWVQDMANTGMAKAGIAASLKNPGWNTSIFICCIRRWAIISAPGARWRRLMRPVS